jgi:transposase-like protein
LQTELTSHLGYEKGSPDAALFSNSRNGSTPKTVATQVGDVDLAVPRDRDGSFVPRLVPKGSRRLGGLDDMIISLYAGGMTIRDIEHHLNTTLGTELSAETISNITDQVCDEVLAWQQRPLDPFYPVIYLDAIVVKVRDGAHVTTKAAHIAVGVDLGSGHGRHQARAGDLAANERRSQVLGRCLRRSGQPRYPRQFERGLRVP